MAERKRWRVTASTLGKPSAPQVAEVEAANWIAALTAAHLSWGRADRLPPGASCAVSPDGTVTVFDGQARRKTVLRELPPVAETTGTVGKHDLPPPTSSSTDRRTRTCTVLHSVPEPCGISRANTSPDPRSPATMPTTALSSSRRMPPRAASQQASPPATAGLLKLIVQRNDDPTAASPLTYRERAFAITPGTALIEAERALKVYLRKLQTELRGAPRGQFVNLAVFDHSWSEIPRRPPLVTLEWMDWRGRETVSYPASALRSQQPATEQEEAERLASLFEAFKDLPHVRSAAAALDLALELLAIAVPCAASSACLYDRASHKLRFVATRGHGAAERQGTAVAPRRGLLGKAMHTGEQASTCTITGDEREFDPQVDGRPGLITQTLLHRPLSHHGQMLGVLQLINRGGGEELFTRGDLNLANYVGDRLGHTLSDLRSETVRPGQRS